jgi:DNA-binding NarL/FixJ family response regulator
VKLLFLTMLDNPNLAAAALELGSVAFVLKQSAGSELLTAIDQVLHGKCYVTPKMRPEDWAVQKVRARQYSTHFTPRQREVVQQFLATKTLSA